MFSWCEAQWGMCQVEQRDEGYRLKRQLHKFASMVSVPLYQLYINVRVTEHK